MLNSKPIFGMTAEISLFRVYNWTALASVAEISFKEGGLTTSIANLKLK